MRHPCFMPTQCDDGFLYSVILERLNSIRLKRVLLSINWAKVFETTFNVTLNSWSVNRRMIFYDWDRVLLPRPRNKAKWGDDAKMKSKYGQSDIWLYARALIIIFMICKILCIQFAIHYYTRWATQRQINQVTQFIEIKNIICIWLVFNFVFCRYMR